MSFKKKPISLLQVVTFKKALGSFPAALVFHDSLELYYNVFLVLLRISSEPPHGLNLPNFILTRVFDDHRIILEKTSSANIGDRYS